MWEIYPWGSYVWAKLYRQLRDANVVRWEIFYAAQSLPNRSLAKYTLSRFTWAFKGVRPNRRLRPDAFEAKAEWWVSSREFFDGRIHEPPRIPSLVNLPSRYDVPKYIDRRFDEHHSFIKELHEKNDAHDKMLKEMYNFYQGMNPCNMSGQMKAPVEVREHYGLTDFSVFQNTQGLPQGGPKMFTTQASSSFFDVPQMTPTYPTMFEQSMPSRYPTSYPGTLHIATPMGQQGFAPWSSTNQAGPSQNRDVGGVNRSPFTSLPETTVAPKKLANNIRNTTRKAKVSPFNLRKAGIDLNPHVEELMFMGSRATDEYIPFYNVDPNKNRPPGARYIVAKTWTASMLPRSHKFVIKTYLHLMGMLDGSSRPYPSWDDVDIVYMLINSGGNEWVTGIINLPRSRIHVIDSLHSLDRIPSLYDQISKWTSVLNVLLEKDGHFKRTGRLPYNFELVYNQGLDFVIPQQANSSDCGVVTCWVIEKLCSGQAPLLDHRHPNVFFSAVRVNMVIRLYECRCEDTSECGYV
ncbi:phospholipase-like protein [Tanacetum coccineum]